MKVCNTLGWGGTGSCLQVLQEIPFHPQSHSPSFLATVPDPLHCLLLPPTLVLLFYYILSLSRGCNGWMNGVNQEGSPFLTTLFIYPFAHLPKNYWALVTESTGDTMKEKAFLEEKKNLPWDPIGVLFLIPRPPPVFGICEAHERNRWGIVLPFHMEGHEDWGQVRRSWHVGKWLPPDLKPTSSEPFVFS